MKHLTPFITGIAVFIAMIIGGGYMTYQLVTDAPIPKEIPSVQRTNDTEPSHVRTLPPQPVAETTLSSSPAFADSETARTLPEDASLARASTGSVTTALAAAVSAQAPPTQATDDEVLTLANLPFGFSRSGLSQQTTTTLEAYVDALGDPQWSVLIQGHTDQEGAIRQNLRLGLRRANAVKHYLMAQGISEHRLHVVSLGEFQPVCSQATAACQSQNRRVSFLVARREQATSPPTLSAPHQKTPQTAGAILPVDGVTHQANTGVDNTDVKAVLKAYEAKVRAAKNNNPLRMEPIDPGVVHGTPASGRPTETMPTNHPSNQNSHVEEDLGQPIIQTLAEEELATRLQLIN